MSKNLKAKIVALVILAVASMAVMGVLLFSMQTNLSLQSYEQEMQQEAEQLPATIEAAAQDAAENKATYDEVYKSKAAQVAFMATHDTGFEATDAKMREYRELLDVNNVLVVKRDGSVVAKAADTRADFSYERFNRLRSALDAGEPSAAVEIDLPDEGWLDRYYAARIDADTMVVIEQDPAELRELTEAAGSTQSVLKNISIGQSGYVFAVSALDYTIQYHPNDAIVGNDALDEGVDVTDLEDGNFTWMKVHGENVYTRVSLIDGMYYISAVPEADLAGARNLTVGVIMFIFFAIMAVVIMYAIFNLRDHERRAARDAAAGKVSPDEGKRGIGFNKQIAGKAALLSVIGLVAMVAVSFYMQTLFALSSEATANSERATEVQATIKHSQQSLDDLTAQYNERYLSKAKVAGYILDKNPALATHDDLSALADALQIAGVYTFDANGDMTATSTTVGSYALSTDPQSQSYPFRRLLLGMDSLVQQPQNDEVSGKLMQYIGVPLHNAEGQANGVLQIAVRPTRLETLTDNVKIENVLPNVKVGADGFAFAVNKADGTMAYFPDERVQGKSALDVGMTKDQLKDGFSDYLTVNGTQYYASSAETDDYYVYVAGSEGDLMKSRGPIVGAVAAISFICQLLIFLVCAIERRGGRGSLAAADAGARNERMIDVEMPDGRTIRTEAATSRWLGKTLGWGEMTPEQKTLTVVRGLVAVTVVCIAIAVVFQKQIFGEGSIFSYILGGGWERGLNIFAITAAVMFICVAMTVVYVIQKALAAAVDVMGARGATMCRLLSSFIKYATIIGMVYYSLMLIGVDTTTLLASAGILSIAISFGAKELVSDILSGLFIIFEGEFRVGDSIQVGTNSGTVMEIGIRTTKIDDGNGNVLVLRNSNISNVINMTKMDSFASCDMVIEATMPLERVESILAKELPRFKEELPTILDGPFYKGVTALTDSTMTLRILARCAEGNRAQLTRDLKREVKLLFEKYDIPVPYTQIVVNQPKDFGKATAWESRRADRFDEEQKEASKDMWIKDEK